METAPAEVRHYAAWRLWRWVEGEKGDTAGDRGKRWTETFGPFFRDCWPQDVQCRDEATSKRLVNAAVVAGDAFEEAVRSILPVLVPFEMWNARVIWVHSESGAELPKRSPCVFVALLNTLIDPDKVRPPRDLGEVLALCLAAEPALATEPSYRRLHAISRSQSA